jgi:hypothetical protein
LTYRIRRGMGVLAQRQQEREAGGGVKIPPFGRGFSRHTDLSL